MTRPPFLLGSIRYHLLALSLAILTLIYLINQQSAYALSCLPFAPLLAAQIYNTQGHLKLSTLFLQKQEETLPPIDISYLYYMMGCGQPAWFFPVTCRLFLRLREASYNSYYRRRHTEFSFILPDPWGTWKFAPLPTSSQQVQISTYLKDAQGMLPVAYQQVTHLPVPTLHNPFGAVKVEHGEAYFDQNNAPSIFPEDRPTFSRLATLPNKY